jgi:hypothetical protein
MCARAFSFSRFDFGLGNGACMGFWGKKRIFPPSAFLYFWLSNVYYSIIVD